MGFRTFPPPRLPQGIVGTKCACGGTVRDWDCGCAWGCDLCSVTAACDTCNKLFRSPSSLPGRGKRAMRRLRRAEAPPCPHCGKKVLGLDAHVQAVHGGVA